jgi:addiction module HigA family antidote
VIEPHDLSVTDAAAKLRVTRQAMSNLLGGRAGLSAEMAIRFEKAFGLSADTLMRMQAAHDLAAVRAREGTIEVDRVAA